ncbi:FadR/GntR family transcriptional regulator [Arthrobacter zhaoguopingii]|uniref:FadR/GntR family transcriptional regulator n=1 Tax=Arthrobacter zhaoguopingii TaxID=2681491 RepID=UPI001359B4B7|nr:GntR family transcriptional regulator [Arthrobacter zhaoguopingii]
MTQQAASASRGLAAVFAPLRSSGLAEQVVERIEQAVETGLLVSGQRLPSEVELAAALGVSPVTAREALSSLRARGLITTTRGRNGGSFVAEDFLPSIKGAHEQLRTLTRLQINDLGLHYSIVTVACAGIAARRADATELAILRTYLRPAEDTLLSWRLVDSEFLLELAAIARSARLGRELVRLQADLGTLTLLPYTDEAFREASVGMRAAVADAIEARDTALAETTTKELVHALIHWLLDEHSR